MALVYDMLKLLRGYIYLSRYFPGLSAIKTYVLDVAGRNFACSKCLIDAQYDFTPVSSGIT